MSTSARGTATSAAARRPRRAALVVAGLFGVGVSASAWAVAGLVSEHADRERMRQAFAEQYPSGRVASVMEYLDDGSMTFDAIVDGTLYRCAAEPAAAELQCAPGRADR